MMAGGAGAKGLANMDTKRVGDFISNLYRANLLTSTNLPANALGAPMGTTALTGLEELLSGNPQMGKAMMREAVPDRFFKGYKGSLDTAQDMIERGAAQGRKG